MVLEMEFYHEGFFGYSLEKDFYYWSWAHFIPIILLIGAILLTYFFRNKLRDWKGEETFRFVLGGILIFLEAFYYWRLLYVGNSGDGDVPLTFLPLQVCEWSAYIAAFMLMKKSRSGFEICYYITLTLGIIPFFMPAVIEYTGPSYAKYYQFWIEHTLPIYGVFYMMFVHGFKPSYKKVWKPLAVLTAMVIPAIILNGKIEGANFMYLAEGTAGDSIANILPQNIWVRLLLYVGIIAVLFTLVSLPQIITQAKERKRTGKKGKKDLKKSKKMPAAKEQVKEKASFDTVVEKEKSPSVDKPYEFDSEPTFEIIDDE